MELVKEKRKHVDKKGNLTKSKVKQKGKKVEKEDEYSNVYTGPVKLHSEILMRKESKEASKSAKESSTSLQSFVEEKTEKKASKTSIPEELLSQVSEQQQQQQLSTDPKLEDKNEENNIVVDLKTSNTILLDETTKKEPSIDPVSQDSNIGQSNPEDKETGEESHFQPDKVFHTSESKVTLEQALPAISENPKQPENVTKSSTNLTNEKIAEEPEIQIPSENQESEKEHETESSQQSEIENQFEVQIEPKEEILEKIEEKNETADEIQSIKVESQNLDKSGENKSKECSSEKLEKDDQKISTELEKDEISNKTFNAQTKSASESTESNSLDLDLSAPKVESELNEEQIPIPIPTCSKTEEVGNVNHEKRVENDKEKVKIVDEESQEEAKEEKGESSIPVESENIPVRETPIPIPEAVKYAPISFHPLTKIPTQLSYKISVENPQFSNFQQDHIPCVNHQVHQANQVKNNQVYRTPFAITSTSSDHVSSASVSTSQSPASFKSVSELENKDSHKISSSLTEEQSLKILQEPSLREFINIPEFKSQFKVPNYKILHLQNLKHANKFQRTNTNTNMNTNSSVPCEEKVPLPISWKKLSEDLGFECLDTEQDEAIAFYNMILWDDLLPPRPTVTATTTPIPQKSSQGYGRPAMSVMSDFFEDRETMRKESSMNGFRSESDTLIDKDATFSEHSWEYSGTGNQYGHYPQHQHQHYYSNSTKSHKNSPCHHTHCDMAHHLHHSYGYESGSPRHHQHPHHQHHHRHLLGPNTNPNTDRSDEAPLFRGKRCRVYTTAGANIRTKTRLRVIKNNIEGPQSTVENLETTAAAAPSSSPWMKTKRMFSKARTVVRSAFRIKGKTEDVDDRKSNPNPNTITNINVMTSKLPQGPNNTDTDTNGEKRVESNFFLPDGQEGNDDSQTSNNLNSNENTQDSVNNTQGVDEFMRDFYYHMDLIDEEMLLAAVQAPDPPTTTIETTGIGSESKTKENENDEGVKVKDTNECEPISILNKDTDKK